MRKRMVAGAILLWVGLAQAEDIPAVLQWSQRVELSPRVSGIVREVRAGVGERVKKEQVLLTLDDQIYRTRVAEASAAVARHREEVAEAKRDLDRTQELYDRAVISTSELDQAKLRHARARSLLDEAQARLLRERKNLEDAVVRAPFDAVVVARQAEPGQNVVVGLQPQPVLALARAGEMVARFLVTPAQIGGLKVGQAVTVVVDGREYPASLKSLGLEPVARKDGIAYPVDALFPVKETLRAGAGATVRLP